MTGAGVVYRGERFFTEGEPFSIVRHAEPSKAHCIVHSHDFVEICYVSAGGGVHVVGTGRCRVEPGDLFVIDHGVPHTFYREEPDRELITCNILFKPGFLDQRLLPFPDFCSIASAGWLEGDLSMNDFRTDRRVPVEEEQELRHLIDKMEREYARKRPGFSLVLRACMIELVVCMLRSASRRDDEELVRADESLSRVIRYIQSHYAKPLRLAELARQSFFSKNYFAERFKRQTGMTVFQFIQQLRIDEARRRIRETEEPLARIAEEVGYADYKAFYIAFKKQTGFTPQAFRSPCP